MSSRAALPSRPTVTLPRSHMYVIRVAKEEKTGGKV